MRVIRKIVRLALLTGLIGFLFCIPQHPFNTPHSTVVYSTDQLLLSAAIAADGQWRFPLNDSLPYKFETALLQFEDEHFYNHNGIYLPAVVRAVKNNVSQGKVTSGASTLTMQVVRLSRKNPPRSLTEKVLEMIRALRLECTHSKKKILQLYAANAPFGGNVVGLEAAAWRYYGRSPHQLSWAEAATLAVLPNAPSLIFPGKNQEKLLQKRNRLLRKLHKKGYLDEETLALSYLEPLPEKPYPLPQHAPHLLHTLRKKNRDTHTFYTTLRSELQLQVTEVVQRNLQSLQSNGVHNAAVIVVEVKTGNVLAYVGNSQDPTNAHQNSVDVIQAPRSTGSILKPFLYAAMLNDGRMLPSTLIPDIPIAYDGFSPQNYTETFDGAVPAAKALSRSLNIPSVIMLRDYGYPRFYHLLKKLPLHTLHQPADHYGLSLILGGAEGSLWDITHAYAGLSRTLIRYVQSGGNYYTSTFQLKNILQNTSSQIEQEDQFPLFSAGSIWSTYQSLLEVNRPETELGWEAYDQSKPIAWKTGTSFGNRDAWAVGTTPEYVVGVWVGNANGQGRPELTGLTSAAPILFNVFDFLPIRTSFPCPFDDLVQKEICEQSGMIAHTHCTNVQATYVPKTPHSSGVCSYHRLIHLDSLEQYQVNSTCYSSAAMRSVPWFELPPVQAHYYRVLHPEYTSPPSYLEGCQGDQESPIALIYPKSDAKLFLPKNETGKQQPLLLKATHRSGEATLYWHIDNVYMGSTKHIHDINVSLDHGQHLLTLVDEDGNTFEKRIEILESR
jgi:penicillin-binding protein 1C